MEAIPIVIGMTLLAGLLHTATTVERATISVGLTDDRCPTLENDALHPGIRPWHHQWSRFLSLGMGKGQHLNLPFMVQEEPLHRSPR